MASYNKKALMDSLGVDEADGPSFPGFAGGSISPTSIAAGEGAPNASPAPVLDQPMPMPGVADAPAAPDFHKTGKYASTAYDAGKLARPWEQQSEKYQIGNVLSNFDPKLGVTPEVLAALNGANIHGAKFSGSGDKLTVDNAGGWDRFGTGGTSDVVQGLKGGNGTWGAWAGEGGGMGGPEPQGGGGIPGIPAFGGVQLDSALSGDPLAKIQQAIAQMSGSRPNFEALMQQLGGGQ